MSKFKKILLYVGVPLILVLVIVGVMYRSERKETVDYSTGVEMVQSGQVSEFKLNLYSGKLNYVTRADNQKHTVTVASAQIFYEDISEAVREYNANILNNPSLTDEQKEQLDIDYNYDRGDEGAWLESIHLYDAQNGRRYRRRQDDVVRQGTHQKG